MDKNKLEAEMEASKQFAKRLAQFIGGTALVKVEIGEQLEVASKTLCAAATHSLDHENVLTDTLEYLKLVTAGAEAFLAAMKEKAGA